MIPQMRAFSVLVFSAMLGMSFMAQAQVYQSTGEDGSVIYSDQPTPDSQEVVVPETNVGDSVEVPPPAPVLAPEPEPEPAVQELPANLEGDLVGYEKKDSKNKRRRRPRPRSGGL